MWGERWSNKREAKDEQNKRVLRQNIQRDVIKRDIKENGYSLMNTLLMDIQSKHVLPLFKQYYLTEV